MTVERLIEILLTCPQHREAQVAVDGKLLGIEAIAEYLPDGPGYDPVIGIECELVDLMEGEEITSYKMR